jgi:hypothetical protein
MQATGTGAIPTRACPRPGVADGIEQHGDEELARQAGRFLVGMQTLSKSENLEWETDREPRTGMRAGIAKKSGNADGVKALTAIDRERTNISYTQR